MVFNTLEDQKAFVDHVILMHTKVEGDIVETILNNATCINVVSCESGFDDPRCFYTNSLFTDEILEAARDLMSETFEDYKARKASDHAKWLAQKCDAVQPSQVSVTTRG